MYHIDDLCHLFIQGYGKPAKHRINNSGGVSPHVTFINLVKQFLYQNSEALCFMNLNFPVGGRVTLSTS